MDPIFIVAVVAAVIALAFALYLAMNVTKQDAGSEEIQFIGRAIQEGAQAFLRREYTLLAVFVVIVAVILALFIDFDITGRVGGAGAFPGTAISYLVGAIGSALAGYIGMSIAVRANTRTAVKAIQGLNPALRVAFNSGTVMGISVVGIGLLGVSILYLAFQDIRIVAGFGFGASSIALFARVGGGIYTKAADVGADLVGKVEQGIPEDDPRNPATIADNVGDNVGDVAGMGADLFESYVGSIIATIALAAVGAAALSIANPGGFDGSLMMLPHSRRRHRHIRRHTRHFPRADGRGRRYGQAALVAADRHHRGGIACANRHWHYNIRARSRLQALLGGANRACRRTAHRHGVRILHFVRVQAD